MRKKFFQQFVTILVAVAILVAGAVYMKSIAIYAIHRGNMSLIAQNAEIRGWNDDMHKEYNQEQSMIVNNSDPIVRWAYNSNAQMKIVSSIMVLLMIISMYKMFKAIKKLKYFRKMKKRKKHHKSNVHKKQDLMYMNI